MTTKKQTREQWLLKLAQRMKLIIESRAGITLPPFRVTCGFPSHGGMMGKRKRTRGQCWSADASEDGHAEIFISPVEDDIETIAAILAHELVHAALPGAGHGKTFQAAVKKIGHEKPFTSAVATGEFWRWARPLIKAAGAYPHRRLNAQAPVAAKKPQKNRQIKCECEQCGYTARTTRLWIEAAGPPHCPVDGHGAMTVEEKAEEGET